MRHLFLLGPALAFVAIPRPRPPAARPRRSLGSAVLALALAGAPAAGGAVVTSDVFVAGEGGYHTYRIPAVLRARDGALLAFCEGRKADASDRGDIDLLLKRSVDGGRTWGAPQVIWDDGENTCGNPCPVLDAATGTIWLFATHNPGGDHEAAIIEKRGQGSRTPWLLRSDDEGRTWSRPVSMASALKDPAWGWYATGPGVGIQLRHGPLAGRLVVPCDHSYDAPGGALRGRYDYGSHVVYSDDHGRTWRLGGVVRPRMNECQVVELADPAGALLLNMRSYRGQGCRAEATSTDGGASWTPPRDQPLLVEPRTQASLLRHAWGDESRPGVLLFSNPADRSQRVRLTVRLSEDDGRSWPRALVLEEGFSAYSCLVALSATEAGCLYERGDDTRRTYARITFARFPIQEIQSPR